jgi:protein-tyrosine-phosphatase
MVGRNVKIHFPPMPTDEQILSNASRVIVVQFGLDKSTHIPHQSPAELIRLYDNLMAMCGGDEKLVMHWLHTGNLHLQYTPALRTHDPYWLKEMNSYLESFRHH